MESKRSQSQNETQMQGRRTFVKKALAGSALISLPAKGVWARSHVNINSSAAASGNGSDAGSVTEYNLKGPDYWRYNCSYQYKNLNFKSVFGRNAYTGEYYDTGPTYKYGSVKTFNKSLIDILIPTKDKYAGCNNYNRLLIALFLNAAQSGEGNVYYPVLDGSQFSDEYAFARYLIDLTYDDPYGSSLYLEQYINDPSQIG